MAPVFWDTGKHSTARKPRYRVSALVGWAWLRDQGMCRVGRSGGSRSEAFQQWLLLEPGEVHSHVSLAVFLSFSLCLSLSFPSENNCQLSHWQKMLTSSAKQATGNHSGVCHVADTNILQLSSLFPVIAAFLISLVVLSVRIISIFLLHCVDVDYLIGS